MIAAPVARCRAGQQPCGCDQTLLRAAVSSSQGFSRTCGARRARIGARLRKIAPELAPPERARVYSTGAVKPVCCEPPEYGLKRNVSG